MTIYTSYLNYPEGDSKEIEHRLSIGQIVDMNGFPLELPLPTSRMIAYRVSRISSDEVRGEHITIYDLEGLTEPELFELTAF